MKLSLVLSLSLCATICLGQNNNMPDELYGFRLGQYKDVVFNELGQPNKTKVFEDSVVINYYYVSKDSSTYLVFQYNPEKPKEIYALQLSGQKTHLPFYGINLGDSESMITSVFGKPDSIFSQNFDDKKAKTWKYIQKNLSLLVIDGRLESIRIWDEPHDNKSDYPSVEELFAIIKSDNKEKICDLLSPGLEIYYCDKVITWKNSFYKDVYVEKASVMDFIMNDTYGLKSLCSIKKLEHIDNLRLIEGVGTFPVFKFPSNPLISEIVLNYQQGRYKIWEVAYRCSKD